MLRYVHSQLVPSASDSSYRNMTLQTGYTSTRGSKKFTQFLLVHMQARFGPTHPYDRAKNWTILYMVHERGLEPTVQLVPGGSAAVQCFNTSNSFTVL